MGSDEIQQVLILGQRPLGLRFVKVLFRCFSDFLCQFYAESAGNIDGDVWVLIVVGGSEHKLVIKVQDVVEEDEPLLIEINDMVATLVNLHLLDQLFLRRQVPHRVQYEEPGVEEVASKTLI